MAEFARRAQVAHAELMVASGNCSAYSGVGDPYLPFRDVMGMLTGDVERAWAAGAITREHACRLWSLTPHTAQTLADEGPDLIDVFVSGSGLVRRATAGAPGGANWLPRLQDLMERERAGRGDLEQPQLFEQYTQVLRALAARGPLLLTLDDLQWADTASINLLFHLGRRLGGSRILILAAYRPSEVALGRSSGDRGEERQHPLEPVITELKRLFGDIQLDMGRPALAEDREFVDAFLDTQPNRLGEEFRQALFRRTRGHPLFTVELLRDMQERGDLIQDEAGRWAEGPALAWGALPARVEAVIEGRIGRLRGELREILTVASVEGEDFTAQVVARVQKADERGLVHRLSRELVKRHRLVGERGSRQVGARRLHLYRFRHSLFQQHLYNGLGEMERELLHGEIGAALEALYGEGCQEMAAQLAWHFAQAGESEKAIEYLLQAGDQARELYAYQEAIHHYQRALAFLKERDEHERAARTLMKLGLTYHIVLDFRRARQAYQEGFTLWQRAGEMEPAAPLPPPPHAFRVSWDDPLTLDPSMADDGSSSGVIEQLFSGLVELSPEMDVVPDVARSWEVLEDGRKYVFHLRDDVRWSDGTPVTAGDFEYAWKRVLDPATGSPNANLLYDVKGARAFHRGEAGRVDVGVRALDEVTLVVELEEPTGYFLHLLACCHATYPVPRHVVEAHGGGWAEVGNIVTNGPFRLEACQPGKSIVLLRNREYHGRFAGNVERVELCLTLDRSALIEMYDADGLDALGLLLPEEIDRARRLYAGEYITVPFPWTHSVEFDVSRPPFDDPRVRRAFVLAADRETLADVVLRGYFSPATGGFVPPGMPGHSAGIGLPYDPDQARQLLAEAGYLKESSRDFPVVDLLATLRESVCAYLQAQWRENLGVEIKLEMVEWSVFYDRLDKEPPHVFIGGWIADYPDPDNFLRVATSKHLWRNEAYESLVEEARQVTDHGERMKLYGQADRILVEEAPLMPISYMRLHLLVKPWVRKYPTPAFGGPFWKNVIIEPH
jgi:ABC-type oligopeptide transport system substrate-binding subunit